ncbi:mCG1042149, partial [Mus musculus]
VNCSCLQTHQKRASDLITDGCEPPCDCWNLNSGPWEEQSVLLTAEPSLQPPGLPWTGQPHCFAGRIKSAPLKSSVRKLREHTPPAW